MELSMSRINLTRLVSFAAIGAALALPSVVAAQNAPKPTVDQPRAERLFQRMDENRDGVLDQSDMDARRARTFERLDANADGKLDEAERAAQAQKREERREARMKRQIERLERLFDRADTDKNGSVSREEFDVEKARFTGEGGKMHERQAKRAERAGERITKLDADKDGAVSKEEFLKEKPAMFERADADKDGKITKAEFDAAGDKMRAEGKKRHEHRKQDEKPAADKAK
jgi:Ca2+-binding EF-hand superfamily protein